MRIMLIHSACGRGHIVVSVNGATHCTAHCGETVSTISEIRNNLNSDEYLSEDIGGYLGVIVRG